MSLGDGAVAAGPHEALDGTILFNLPGIARALVRSDAVTVQREPGVSDADLAWLCSGYIRTVRRVATQRFSLWAAGVVIGDSAVGLIGKETSGKSAVAAALALRGNSVLSDAALPVELREGSPFALPTGNELELWPGAVDQLGLSQDGGRVVREGLSKRAYEFTAGLATPLRTIVLLQRSPGEGALEVETVGGGGAIEAIGRATWMRALVTATELRVAHFLWLTPIAAACRLLRVRSDRFEDNVAAAADAIEAAVR
jgi:hypothetical protein